MNDVVHTPEEIRRQQQQEGRRREGSSQQGGPKAQQHKPKERDGIPLHVRLERIEKRLEAAEKGQAALNEGINNLVENMNESLSELTQECEDNLNRIVSENKKLVSLREDILSEVMEELEGMAAEAIATAPTLVNPEGVVEGAEPWYKDRQKMAIAGGIAGAVVISGVAYRRHAKKKEQEKFPF